MNNTKYLIRIISLIITGSCIVFPLLYLQAPYGDPWSSSSVRTILTYIHGWVYMFYLPGLSVLGYFILVLWIPLFVNVVVLFFSILLLLFKEKARRFFVTYAFINTVGIGFLLYTMVAVRQRSMMNLLFPLVHVFLSLLIQIGFIFYLTHPKVKALFSPPKQDT